MIPIRNIYYMLSYAFSALRENGYRSLAAEDYHNTAELCAAILARGIGIQLKRGLRQGYREYTEPLSTLHGRPEISESIKTQAILKKQLICTYEEFSVDTEMNRILKATMRLLLRTDIGKSRKKELRGLLLYFSEVKGIDLRTANWKRQYDRNNASYQMLISICWLVYKGLLQSQRDGTVKMADYLDEQRMCRLYERFLLAYYRKEHPELSASASQIAWQLDDDSDAMLPRMQTDILLAKGSTILIIDAKYYAHTTQVQFGVHTLHSNNLYQIFTYVKNKEYELSAVPHQVSGMLLYAKTDEDTIPDQTYRMSGNQISVKTLDLDCDFSEIRKQLDEIAASHFPVSYPER